MINSKFEIDTEIQPRKNKIGLKFGTLTIIQYIGFIKETSDYIYECLCDCGETKITRWRSLSSKDCKCLKCGSKYGKEHPAWKGVGDFSKNHFNAIRHSAAAKNLEFDLDMEFLWNLYIKQNKKCALLGLDIYFDSYSQSHSDKNLSLDRIDPNQGYIKTNVQWVHRTINNLKSDLHNDAFIYMCDQIASQKHVISVEAKNLFFNYKIRNVRNKNKGDHE